MVSGNFTGREEDQSLVCFQWRFRYRRLPLLATRYSLLATRSSLLATRYSLLPQHQDRLQARRVVLEPELATMQAGDRRGKAQAQAGAGLRAALLEPDEPLHRARPIDRRNAGPGIGHAQHHVVDVR